MNRTINITQTNLKKTHPVAVVLHLYYTELFDELRTYLRFLGNNIDLYISISEENESFIQTINNFYPNACIVKIKNKGRDIAPFLEILNVILPLEYELLLKIHTKETPHRSDGIAWRKDVLNKLLGSEIQIENIKKSFSNNPNIAMIGPKDHVLDSRYYMGSNHNNVQMLLYKAGYTQSLPESFSFVASTMFWAKPDVFRPILDMEIDTDNFESEPIPDDGCLPHAMERFLGLLVQLQGYEIKSIDENGLVSNPDPFKIYPFATAPAHLRLRQLKSIVFYSAYKEPYAIEHLRITAPFTAAGIEIIDGVKNGTADPDLAGQGDAVIFQREFPKNVILYDQIVANARAAGKFVFYEIDDLLFNLPENHPERIHEVYNNALLPMITATVNADLVFVPTEELKRTIESFNPNVIVLPNYLDDTLWQLRPPKFASDEQLLKIGYMGSDSHTPDLAIIAPVIKEIVAKYDGKVNVDIWGTPLPEELQNVEGVNWHPSPTNVYKDFVKFFQTLEFDIAIAPLADNLFNRCKSGLKFLEYSANGVAGVFSKLPPYESIVSNGENGLLAGSSDEWYEALTRLIDKPTLRYELAKCAQKVISDNWLLTKSIQTWNDIFEKLSTKTYLEDSNKMTRTHIYNVINKQLYVYNLNRESHLLKREEEFSARFQELEAAHLEDTRKTVSIYEEQIEQKQNEFESYSLKREEEFSARFQELEAAHLEDTRKTISMYEKQIGVFNEHMRRLLDESDSLNEQLYYWSGQASKKSAEIKILQDRLIFYERELNEIHQSGAWKVLSSHRENVNKLTRVRKKMSNIVAPLDRIISGRLAKKKQTIIDSGLFDSDYYLRKNPDVKNAGVDPLEHFLNFGGTEGRNPSPEFDSSRYLEENQDVQSAGMNPLLHYLLHGKAEGRAIQEAATSKGEIGSLVLNDAKKISAQKSIPEVIILAPKIKEILEKRLKQNYVLSLSHDDYLTVTGGAQVYITDEQRLVNQNDQSYLHVYPRNKKDTLVSSDDIFYLCVNLDGVRMLEAESNELVNSLTDLSERKLTKLSIHHSMGFNTSTLQAFLDLAGKKGVFWLHDYFSLCPSYNLRRNDKEYCAAPDINSNACKLCSYVDQRRVQALDFEKLFEENQLEVAAPSRFCYEFWQSRFPVFSPGRIIPPAVLRWGRNMPGKFKGRQLRIGFLGYPLDYKGWSTWLKVINKFKGKQKYRFFHFSTQHGERGDYSRIDTKVTKENRLAMVDNLKWNQIDVAFLWSTVAETFSFTLHEALAAGCYIVTNPYSGNIQDYLRRNPARGIVLDGEEELFDYLDTDNLLNQVIEYQKQGKPQAELIYGGLEETN